MNDEIKKKQSELEDGYITEIQNIDKNAEELYKKNPKKAVRYLTDYSVNAGNSTVIQWKEFYKFLFTKYVDGNVKEKRPVPPGYKYVTPKVSQPGYSEEWYRAIVNATGDKLKEK
jgi:hypothetical protein